MRNTTETNRGQYWEHSKTHDAAQTAKLELGKNIAKESTRDKRQNQIAVLKADIFQVQDPYLRRAFFSATSFVDSWNEITSHPDNFETQPDKNFSADKISSEQPTATQQNSSAEPKASIENQKAQASTQTQETILKNLKGQTLLNSTPLTDLSGATLTEFMVENPLEKLKAFKDQNLLDFKKSLCFIKDTSMGEELQKLLQRFEALEEPQKLAPQEKLETPSMARGDFSFSRHPEAKKILSQLHSMLGELESKLIFPIPLKVLEPRSPQAKLKLIWTISIILSLVMVGILTVLLY